MVSAGPPGLFACECGYASCRECLDRWRGPFRQRLADFLNGFDTVTLVTVIFTQPTLRQGDLAAVDPVALQKNARMMLRRNGLSHVPAVGILEADWNERKFWEPHLHLFVPGERPDTQQLAEWLRSRDPYQGQAPEGVYRPVQRDELITDYDVVDAIAYATKFKPTRKRAFHVGDKTTGRKVSLRGAQLRAAQHWLTRPLRDFVYLQNIRLDSAGFRLTGLLSGKPPKSSI